MSAMADDDTMSLLAALAFGAVGLFISSLDNPSPDTAGLEEAQPPSR
jgi:hypothetical protein